jgi:hypothetical protein
MMRMPTVLLVSAVGLVLLTGCGGDRKSALEQKYHRLTFGMSHQEVVAILGPGRQVTAAQIAAVPEYPKLDTTGLREDTVWYVWDGSLQYVLVGFNQDKAILTRITGSSPPRRLGT